MECWIGALPHLLEASVWQQAQGSTCWFPHGNMKGLIQRPLTSVERFLLTSVAFGSDSKPSSCTFSTSTPKLSALAQLCMSAHLPELFPKARVWPICSLWFVGLRWLDKWITSPLPGPISRLNWWCGFPGRTGPEVHWVQGKNIQQITRNQPTAKWALETEASESQLDMEADH